MNMITALDSPGDYSFRGTRKNQRQGLVVICDAPDTVDRLEAVCEFFDLAVEIVPTGGDLMQTLQEHRPMAIISGIDRPDQDGYHAMKVASTYDRDLPVMLLTDGEPALIGAADAVQEMWNLTTVTKSTNAPLAGQLVDFLVAAGRRAGCMRLVPI